jgi:glycosyltransferase involved in cell wall biosynthesis
MSKGSNATVVALFFSSHADSVGNAYRFNRMLLLSKNLKLIIVTNIPEVLSSRLPQAKIIKTQDLHYNGVLGMRGALKIKSILDNLEYAVLYYFHNDAVIAFFDSHPKICEIHQSHEIIGLNNGLRPGMKGKLKKLLFHFRAFLLIKGVKRARYIFAVSPQLKELFIKKGTNHNKIEYLPQGVNTALFNPENVEKSKILQSVPADRFVMVYTGWVSENRGLKIMLEGLRAIQKQAHRIHLVIAGCEEEYIQKINNFASAHHLEENLSVFGRLSYDEMPKLIARANVCLSFLEANPSYSMSPPQKIFEYFAMGKPVIANKIPTHTDYITDGYNGRIIENLEVNEFAKVILDVMKDDLMYKDLCNNALKYSEKFDMKHIGKRLLSKIEMLISDDK